MMSDPIQRSKLIKPTVVFPSGFLIYTAQVTRMRTQKRACFSPDMSEAGVFLVILVVIVVIALTNSAHSLLKHR